MYTRWQRYMDRGADLLGFAIVLVAVVIKLLTKFWEGGFSDDVDRNVAVAANPDGLIFSTRIRPK